MGFPYSFSWPAVTKSSTVSFNYYPNILIALDFLAYYWTTLLYLDTGSSFGGSSILGPNLHNSSKST